MAAGLVKVAEGVLVVIQISGPCITRRPALLGVDGVVMRPLGLFFPVMDVFIVTRVFPFRFLIRPVILRRCLRQLILLRQYFRLYFDDYVVCGFMEHVLDRTRIIQVYPLSKL